MIANCVKCGWDIVRYGTDEEMHAPCENCGGVVFLIQHATFFHGFFVGFHEFEMNIQTGEKLTLDLCDTKVRAVCVKKLK